MQSGEDPPEITMTRLRGGFFFFVSFFIAAPFSPDVCVTDSCSLSRSAFTSLIKHLSS